MVSGAQTIDTAKPTAEIMAAAIIMACEPYISRKEGSTYIETTVPILEKAIANPIAVPLTSVGNSSLGYSHCRFPGPPASRAYRPKQMKIVTNEGEGSIPNAAMAIVIPRKV